MERLRETCHRLEATWMKIDHAWEGMAGFFIRLIGTAALLALIIWVTGHEIQPVS